MRVSLAPASWPRCPEHWKASPVSLGPAFVSETCCLLLLGPQSPAWSVPPLICAHACVCTAAVWLAASPGFFTPYEVLTPASCISPGAPPLPRFTPAPPPQRAATARVTFQKHRSERGAPCLISSVVLQASRTHSVILSMTFKACCELSSACVSSLVSVVS